MWIGDGIVAVGTGSPEGVVRAPKSRLYARTDDNTIWFNETGIGSTTGWASYGGGGGGGISDGDKVDIVVTDSGATWTIDARAVTAAKLFAASAASRLLLRGSAGGAGDWQEGDLDASLSISGTTMRIAPIAASSVLGRTNNSSGVPAAIQSDTDFQSLIRVDGSLRWHDLSVFDDFVNTPTISSSPFKLTVSGGTVTSQAVPNGSTIGVVRLSTGTGGTGRATVLTAPDAFCFGVRRIIGYAKFSLPALSTATDRFTIFAGHSDSTNGNPTDGVFIRYCDNVNSGKFEVVARASGVEEVSDSFVTVAANTDYVVTYSIEPGGTYADIAINGVLMDQLVTEVPSGTGEVTGFGIQIQKSVSSGVASFIDIDKMAVVHRLTP